MNITLRAGERFFINGAVIRIDRKASIELLNEVTFLLEAHVMQAEKATTLVRGRNFEALKSLRALFALEDKELQPLAKTPSAA